MARLTNAAGAVIVFLLSVVLMTSCSTAKDEKNVSSETTQTVAETTTIDDKAITPSFDCAKAKTKVEKLICSDPELARLDREMADKYNAMYQQMRNENPNDLDRYNQDYPKLLVRRQKGWIERRNKLKNIDALKKAYKEQIGVIESYEYLKGCYKILSYKGSFVNTMQDFSNSIIHRTLCYKFERYHWTFSIFYSLLDPQKRRESLYEEIKEKEKLKRKFEEMYSRKKWKEIDDLYKKNPKEANNFLANKLIEDKDFSNNKKKEILKEKIDSFFSNVCDFYVASEGYGGLRGASVDSIRYKEPDGEYTLHYVGLAHSCAFYTYKKTGRGPNAPSVSVKTPAMKGSCYPHEPPIVYKGNDYIKLSARDVTDNLHGAKYALYRFDQKSVSFIYDCSIKE